MGHSISGLKALKSPADAHRGNRRKMKSTGCRLLAAAGALAVAYAGMESIAVRRREDMSIDDGNPYHPADTVPPTKYERYVKPSLGRALSFFALIAFSPLFAAIAIAIEIDDPGPVFFRQKRVGKDGRFFMMHKFRSMKTDAPSEVPTHELQDPGRYITRTGKFLRKTSLDEIPQLWDVFRGKLALVSPRPALWNQADLVDERRKNGSVSVRPGITGWAQINGRDELEIKDKARLDGEYAEHLRKGGLHAFLFDCRCFFGTFAGVLGHDGIVEGGTGRLHAGRNH